jgi:hypothetical protein
MKANNMSGSAMMLSIALIVLGLAIALAGIGLKFYANMRDAVDFSQMLICMLAVVLFSFAYGAVRHSLAAGAALGLIALHDQLLTLALISLVSILVPQSQNLPFLIVMAVAFTYCQSLPLLRAAIELRASTTLRDMDHTQVAAKAVSQTAKLRLYGAIIALLLLIAGFISGNGLLAAFLSPLLIGLLVSVFSARFILPSLWIAMTTRLAHSKTKR